MKIQTSITGFRGPPVTLVSMIDDDTGLLVIAKPVAYRQERIDDTFAFVTNTKSSGHDYQFNDDDLSAAISVYFRDTALELITLADAVSRFNPQSRLEADSMTDLGMRYRIGTDIDCGQIAVLATAFFYDKQQSIKSTLDILSDYLCFSI